MLDMIDATRLHNSLILVVDDIEVNRRVLAHSLNGHGYGKIVLAADGLQALQMTRDLKPDLVILDLMMPAMDGFSYCRTIRQDKRFDTMPIIVQTAIDGMENKLKAFKSGASDYICKPVDPGELAARTQVHLNQRFLMEDLREYRKRISNELDIARVMQNRLLPDDKQIELYEHVYNLKIANEFRTSSTLGGDCWGMRPMGSRGLAVYMFDFSGHGVSAALNVFRMHTLMHECQNSAGDPGQFLATLSHRLRPLLGKDEFASMFYGIIDVEENCLHYATAAVPASLVFNGNDATILSGNGFPLGILSDVTYDTQRVALPPESLLLFFSDGMMNAKGADGSFLEESDIKHEVRRMLATRPDNPATATVELLRKRLYDGATHAVEDDVTLSAYWRRPQPY